MIFNSSPPQHHSSTPTTNHNTNHNYTNHELPSQRRLCSLGSACGRRRCASPPRGPAPACSARCWAGAPCRPRRCCYGARPARAPPAKPRADRRCCAACRSHPLRQRATCRAGEDRCAARTRSLLRRTPGCRELGHVAARRVSPRSNRSRPALRCRGAHGRHGVDRRGGEEDPRRKECAAHRRAAAHRRSAAAPPPRAARAPPAPR